MAFILSRPQCVDNPQSIDKHLFSVVPAVYNQNDCLHDKFVCVYIWM